MVQATLNIGTEVEESVKVPIFIFKDKQEAKLLAELFVTVKPSYLINISNSVEALKSYCKGRITKEVVFIMNNETFKEVQSDKGLFNKIRLIEVI